MRQANFKLHIPDKCEFLQEEVNYLGHVISRWSKTRSFKSIGHKKISIVTK